jgi:hypothetical protein
MLYSNYIEHSHCAICKFFLALRLRPQNNNNLVKKMSCFKPSPLHCFRNLIPTVTILSDVAYLRQFLICRLEQTAKFIQIQPSVSILKIYQLFMDVTTAFCWIKLLNLATHLVCNFGYTVQLSPLTFL